MGCIEEVGSSNAGFVVDSGSTKRIFEELSPCIAVVVVGSVFSVGIFCLNFRESV